MRVLYLLVATVLTVLSFSILVPNKANAAWTNILPTCGLDKWDVKTAIQSLPAANSPFTLTNDFKTVVSKNTSGNIQVMIFPNVLSPTFVSTNSTTHNLTTPGSGSSVATYFFTPSLSFSSRTTTAPTSFQFVASCVEFANGISYAASWQHPNFFTRDFDTWQANPTPPTNPEPTEPVDYPVDPLSFGHKVGIVLVLLLGFYVIKILQYKRTT